MKENVQPPLLRCCLSLNVVLVVFESVLEVVEVVENTVGHFNWRYFCWYKTLYSGWVNNTLVSTWPHIHVFCISCDLACKGKRQPCIMSLTFHSIYHLHMKQIAVVICCIDKVSGCIVNMLAGLVCKRM